MSREKNANPNRISRQYRVRQINENICCEEHDVMYVSIKCRADSKNTLAKEEKKEHNDNQ